MTGSCINFYNGQNTQRAYRGIVANVINLYGIPIRYLPKKLSNEDVDPFGTSALGDDIDVRSNTGLNDIYGEDINISYNDSISMKAMLENYDDFNGMHNFFSKFGMSMDDEIILQLETETWRNLMSKHGYELNKPKEGDLIIFEISKAKGGNPMIFEIKYCNESKSYFIFGELLVFEINCKLWEYSHETLETGDEKIDSLNDITGDDPRIGDNETISKTSEKVTVWNPNDPYGESDD